jgi:large conductance mechanosensitive channel
MLRDFKAFVLRGNVVDLAIGVVIGASFAAVVATFTEGVVTPLLGLFGNTDFSDLSACLKNCSGGGDAIALRYGAVLTALLTFLLTALVLFFFVVKPVNVLMDRRRTEPDVDSTTKSCGECLSSIPVQATRCAFCTVEQ